MPMDKANAVMTDCLRENIVGKLSIRKTCGLSNDDMERLFDAFIATRWLERDGNYERAELQLGTSMMRPISR